MRVEIKKDHLLFMSTLYLLGFVKTEEERRKEAKRRYFKKLSPERREEIARLINRRLGRGPYKFLPGRCLGDGKPPIEPVIPISLFVAGMRDTFQRH